ncbi:hypothetical protein HDR58_10480 [bacterium]|nr:hypothetical protein [bacterium]
MSGIDIRRFLNNFNQNNYKSPMMQSSGASNSFVSQTTQNTKPAEVIQNSTTLTPTPTGQIQQNVQLNTLQSLDRSIYAKDLLQMPRNMNEFIYMLQRGLTQSQFNQMFANQLAAQRNSLSQLQAQILAQLQGLDTSISKEMVNVQLAGQLQASLKNLEILSGGMINLADISILLQKNGKEALTKLIMTMTEASKSGVTDLSQMKEMAKLINASISIAAENNPQKTLKLLLMLYLPWLPLEDGVGFDLEIESSSPEHEESDSILTITITTVNFGAVIATLILETSNSVQTSIECNEKFPINELQLRIDKDKKHYAVDTVTTFNVNKDIKPQTQKASANINMAQTTEINPYLLLTAHSIIKHVIDIDNNKTLGITSHTDIL